MEENCFIEQHRRHGERETQTIVIGSKNQQQNCSRNCKASKLSTVHNKRFEQ